MQIQRLCTYTHCKYLHTYMTWFFLPYMVRFVEKIHHHLMFLTWNPTALHKDQHLQTSELLSCKTKLYFKHYGETCIFTVIQWHLLLFSVDHWMQRPPKDSMSGSLNLILFTRIVPSSQQINLSAEQTRHWLAKKPLSGFHRRQPGLGRSQLPPLIPFDKLLWKSCLFSFSLRAFR